MSSSSQEIFTGRVVDTLVIGPETIFVINFSNAQGRSSVQTASRRVAPITPLGISLFRDTSQPIRAFIRGTLVYMIVTQQSNGPFAASSQRNGFFAANPTPLLTSSVLKMEMIDTINNIRYVMICQLPTPQIPAGAVLEVTAIAGLLTDVISGEPIIPSMNPGSTPIPESE